LPLVLVIMVCSPLPRFELTGLQSVASDHVDRWGSVPPTIPFVASTAIPM